MSKSIFVPHKQKSAKIGRPKLPKEEAKSDTVRVRVTHAEYKSIKLTAESAGQDISEWARAVMLSASL